LHKVFSVSSPVSRSTCGEYAGLLYTDITGFGGVVPALKRRKSEGGAKKKPPKPILSNKIFVILKIKLYI
jgi:hypothetical protein